VVLSRTQSEVAEPATQVGALGRRALALKVDVSKREDVKRMVRSTIHEFGKVDILVNNAGILGPVGPVVDNDVKEWIKTVNINLIGAFICTKMVLPIMIERRQGKIINLSGGGATGPRPRFSAYAASKAALVRFTETLAEEVKEFNIQVNAIAPGALNTRMHDQVLAVGEAAGERELALSRRVKNGKVTPFEVPAALAVFLASDESDGLTGRLISAVWDDWRSMSKEKIEEIMGRELYTLRRIDDFFFTHIERQPKKK